MDRFEEAKAKIKDAVDLVGLVESYLPLKRTGRNMVGLCPFHAEKTPSFTVSPATQHYKCFGCGKAGDVFTFLMEREGIDFRTAFELLAQRAGVPRRGRLLPRQLAERRRRSRPGVPGGSRVAGRRRGIRSGLPPARR
jgi:DNA primase catalytic core